MFGKNKLVKWNINRLICQYDSAIVRFYLLCRFYVRYYEICKPVGNPCWIPAIILHIRACMYNIFTDRPLYRKCNLEINMYNVLLFFVKVSFFGWKHTIRVPSMLTDRASPRPLNFWVIRQMSHSYCARSHKHHLKQTVWGFDIIAFAASLIIAVIFLQRTITRILWPGGVQ